MCIGAKLDDMALPSSPNDSIRLRASGVSGVSIDRGFVIVDIFRRQDEDR